MANGLVGIIANPASGKDIRRLVAHGSTFDNNEKINIVRRVLLALDSIGVERVVHLPDDYGIVPRAAGSMPFKLELSALEMPILANPGDSYEAAARLADLGADTIVTLGGDGTNRMVVKGAGETPLVPISTGTNNVFPEMIEGTIAGLAAGLVSTCDAVRAGASVRQPRLDVLIDDVTKDLALIDVVTSQHAWIGARALWDPSHLREIVLSRIAPAEIGICGLGGILFPAEAGSDRGIHLQIGDGGHRVLAPLAPGLMKTIPIAGAELVERGERVELDAAPCTIALDGEREFEILKPGHKLEVVFNPDGPFTVDVAAAIRIGAETGAFTVAAAAV